MGDEKTAGRHAEPGEMMYPEVTRDELLKKARTYKPRNNPCAPEIVEIVRRVLELGVRLYGTSTDFPELRIKNGWP
ncbi:hypothetical protein [Corynebacterium antarcticum]|uniref:hypothetical protein n=1 Tax=Corynebacterium antarcticum TaxID=2800405 RepID=UPI00200437DB|nr:hypothetical protein [Corynebacterium antarcticum]MCK7660047.1 hypothetical protein [Corynebacterium antarcticum]